MRACMARDRRLAGDRWRFPPSGSRFRYHHNDVSRSIILARVPVGLAWMAASFLISTAEAKAKAGSVLLVSTAPSLQPPNTPCGCIPSARVTSRSGINRFPIGAANTSKFVLFLDRPPRHRHARTAKNLFEFAPLSDKGKPLRLLLKVLPITSHQFCTEPCTAQKVLLSHHGRLRRQRPEEERRQFSGSQQEPRRGVQHAQLGQLLHIFGQEGQEQEGE